MLPCDRFAIDESSNGTSDHFKANVGSLHTAKWTSKKDFNQIEIAMCVYFFLWFKITAKINANELEWMNRDKYHIAKYEFQTTEWDPFKGSMALANECIEWLKWIEDAEKYEAKK